MLEYILKSAACMAVFLLFYKLLLEKENMHVFKRFYLLGGLVASFIIPSLVFVEYVEHIVISTPISTAAMIQTNATIPATVAQDSNMINFSFLVLSIYLIGVFGFGIRFFRNLFQIIRRIRKNTKVKSGYGTRVLLREMMAPHTFFSYIFLNKVRFDSNEIPKEVLLHEETHAKQRHSFDVLIIEFLQVLVWFNPIIYFFKKAIKLNHEFLADKAVLQKDVNTKTYQNTLLSYLSPDSAKKYQPQLANAINYSSIKKRFKIMKTHTSKKAVLLRTLLLLPLLTIVIYGFSETKLIEKTTSQSIEPIEPIFENQKLTIDDHPTQTVEEILIHINKNGQLLVKDEIIDLKDLESYLAKINKHLTNTQKRKVVKSIIKTDKDVPKIVIDKVSEILINYGSATIDIIGPKSNSNFKSQDGASRKLMSEYNALAKKYNTMLSKSKGIQIKMKDVERLEFIYNQMSDKQKADAEPFPDFPPMPESPTPPKAPRVKKREKSDIPSPPPTADHEEIEKAMELKEAAKMREQEVMMEGQEILMEKQESQMEEQVILLSRQVARTKEHETELIEIEEVLEKVSEIEEVPEVEETTEVEEIIEVEPPMPPTLTKSPLDHVKEMAKQGATFYYEGKEISSDKAINILKNNNEINIDSRTPNGKRPEVKLSIEPITINN